MNISALEKMNKNKELADDVMDEVEHWLHSCRRRQDKNVKLDLSRISDTEWSDLQARIERLLEE